MGQVVVEPSHTVGINASEVGGHEHVGGDTRVIGCDPGALKGLCGECAQALGVNQGCYAHCTTCSSITKRARGRSLCRSSCAASQAIARAPASDRWVSSQRPCGYSADCPGSNHR